MSEYAYNVWIEIKQVEMVDGSDMFYQDRSTDLAYVKAGRFASLTEAVSFGNHLNRRAADDLRDSGDSLADRALAGLTHLHTELQLGTRSSFGPPSSNVALAVCELMNTLELEVH